MTTDMPAEKPKATARIRNCTDMLPLMAASAFLPSKLPTIIESTVEYSCWNTFPISIGTANVKMTFIGLPVVKSLAIGLLSVKKILTVS